MIVTFFPQDRRHWEIYPQLSRRLLIISDTGAMSGEVVWSLSTLLIDCTAFDDGSSRTAILMVQVIGRIMHSPVNSRKKNLRVFDGLPVLRLGQQNLNPSSNYFLLIWFFRKHIGKCYGGSTTIWWKCRSESESFDVLGSLLEPSSRPTTTKTKFLKKLIFAVVEIVSATHRFELHLHASERWILLLQFVHHIYWFKLMTGLYRFSIKKKPTEFRH